MVSLKDRVFINIYLFHLFIVKYLRGNKNERGIKKEPTRNRHRRRGV